MGKYTMKLNNFLDKSFDFEALHRDRKMDRTIARNNIISLKKVFEKHNINYWLCYGTLLGAIREDNFIEHDVDTDIAINVNEINKLENSLIDIIEEGFEVIRVSSDFSLVSILRNGEYIDIYLFRKINNHENMTWYCSGYTVKEDYFSDLGNISFLGESFSAPTAYLDYLNEIYGDDWRIPKKNAHASPGDVAKETYKVYYELLCRWLEDELNGKSIHSFLELAGYKNIVVYGLGQIGQRLIQDISKNANLNIVGVMDKNIENDKYEKYNVISQEQLATLEKAVVIITPVYFLSLIKEDISKMNSKLILLGINEILQ